MKRIYSIPCSISSSDACVFKWQNKKSKYLAVTTDNVVNIYNRHGEHIDQINLFGNCTSLKWNENGDWLAIITNRSPLIFLWSSITKKLEQIDSGMKETLCIIAWSRINQSTLFVGTVKGNMLIYNNQTFRKNPIYGKHSKKILSCCWSDSNLIALVGDDRLLTVNNEDGETLAYNPLKGDGSNVKFFYSFNEDQQQQQQPESKTANSNGNINGNNNNATVPTKSNNVCVVLNKRMLYLVNVNDSENSFILNFKDWYEYIVDYYCYHSGNIFIAFSSGLIVTVSTGYKTFGVELFQVRAHRDSLSTLNVCSTVNRIATCSENNIKIFDLHDHNEIENVFTVDDEPSITNIDWTDDGQLLAFGSSTGNIHVYLSQLKIIGDSYGTSLAFLSSLLEVTVFNVHEEVQDSVMIIRIEIEPSRIAIGPFHLAVVMNNKVWLYSITGNELMNLLINECEYSGIIKDIKLNNIYMSILFTNGTLQFHPIEQNQHNSGNTMDTIGNDNGNNIEYNRYNPNQSRKNLNNNNNNDNNNTFTTGSDKHFTYFTYPDGLDVSNKKNNVTTHCLTNQFLIFALDSGSIIYFVIKDWNYTVIYRHNYSIQMIQSNFNGTRLVLIDERNETFVYNVYNETLIQISTDNVPLRPLKILWESCIHDQYVFTICDCKYIYVYSSPIVTIDGPKVEFVGKMKIPSGQYPLLLYNGVMVCQTKSGKTSNFILSTHDYAIKNNNNNNLKKDIFDNVVKLRRYQDAIKMANLFDDEDLLLLVGRSAIKDLEINVAIQVYKLTKKYSLVYCLEQFRDEEEQNLLYGLLAEMISEYDLAQKHFLNSTRPLFALEMRQNLQHWNEALGLARHLSPNDIPYICIQLARQQEYSQEYSKALENFESALSELKNNETTGNIIQQCYAGIARTAIRCGNLKRALTMAANLDDTELMNEFANILESFNYLQEAASLYEKCGQFDQAAALYLKVKNLSRLAAIFLNIKDSKILCQYGMMKEREKQYRQAVDIYAKAGEWNEVVRINLEHLNKPGEAVKIVRDKQSVDGAKLVARYYQKQNDMTAAIEFLIISQCYDDAYNLALTTNQMDIYADIMQDHINDDNLSYFRTIAIYYEQANDQFTAGKYYCLAKIYKKGIRLLLDSTANPATNENETLSLVIDAAALANDEQITRLILDFLMGETDGIPRDFKFLFRLYMRLQHYNEAAKTAVIIAQEEQNSGNYRNAHQLLFSMCAELKTNGITIPSEMATNLMLIHSYMLAKIWIRAGDHKISSKLLIRVYDNINQFPAHSVQILTFVVIECLRAGYLNNALKFAFILMKQENRDQIDAKFRKKIENLVRKSSRTPMVAAEELQKELAISTSQCPYCSEMVKDDVFTCHSCLGYIPFCIASGMHIRKDDLTKCPKCQFPASKRYLLDLMSLKVHQCPMCEQEIDLEQIQPVSQLQDIFNLYAI